MNKRVFKRKNVRNNRNKCGIYKTISPCRQGDRFALMIVLIFVGMTDMFKIFQVDVQEAERISDQVNEPHAHTYEELLIGIEGQLEHFIDFKTSLLQAPYISFVSKGKIHRVQPRILNGVCQVWVIRFRGEFIAETTFQLYAAYHDNAHLQMSDEDCFRRLVQLVHMMYDFRHNVVNKEKCET